VRKELTALTKSGKTLGVRSFYNFFFCLSVAITVVLFLQKLHVNTREEVRVRVVRVLT
jgi:hypothetical protein